MPLDLHLVHVYNDLVTEDRLTEDSSVCPTCILRVLGDNKEFYLRVYSLTSTNSLDILFTRSNAMSLEVISKLILEYDGLTQIGPL